MDEYHTLRILDEIRALSFQVDAASLALSRQRIALQTLDEQMSALSHLSTVCQDKRRKVSRKIRELKTLIY